MPTLAVTAALVFLARVLADRLDDRFGDDPGFLDVRAREDDRELVAAQAGQHVALAHAAAQDPGNFADQPVASRVAATVVDLLEVVEVEHQHRPGAALAVAAGHLAAQVLLEAAAVLQPGQRILARLTPQLLEALVTAPDDDQGGQQGGEGDADPADQERQADAGPVGVADD